jgi:hypothetical protein
MQSTRRGFFSTLAGALLGGAVVGPKLLQAAPVELWQAAPNLPITPVVNQYVPLEAFTAEVLRIMNEELKWLRLKQTAVFHVEGRPGYTAMTRRLVCFTPIEFDSFPQPKGVIRESFARVPLLQPANVAVPLDGLDRYRPFDEIARRHIQPTAYSLAEQIIQSVRRNGGAEYLVTAPQSLPNGVDKALIMNNPDAGLNLRAVVDRYVCPDSSGRARPPELRIDMLYGLG